MTDARGTTVAQGFSNKLLLEMYDKSLLDQICNRDYQGEINDVGSKLNILNIARISEKTYTGADLSMDSLYENNAVLEITELKSFYWGEKTIDNFYSYIKNPHSTVVTQAADERNMNMDTFALGLYEDVAAGNRVGTDFTTGTVSIDADGIATHSGTGFLESMEGKGIKATGHDKWYRVKDYLTTATLQLEDDLDDVTSDYTGGVITGATFTIEALTAVAVTTSNLLSKVAQMKLKLNKAQANSKSAVPTQGRALIMPPEFETLIINASGIALHVPDVYTNLVQKGLFTMLDGFMVFISNGLTGDNTNGYHCLAIHPNWLTFAEKLLSATMEEDLKGNFGSAYKDLFVYGGKVADSRRHFAAEGFFTFTIA